MGFIPALNAIFRPEASWEDEDRASYINRCCVCDKDFLGGKRRIICRLCANESTIQPS